MAGEGPAGCCDDESDFCVGVTLQFFLAAILLVSLFSFYWVVLPGWLSTTTATGAASGVSFGVSYALMLASYLRTWLTDPGSVPDGWKPEEEMGELKYCRRCEQHRPPRAQHCKQCGKCVLRMDHHCPWVQNCVGARNHKYFMLFLFWAFVCCAQYSASVLFLFVKIFRGASAAAIRDLGPNFGMLLGMEIAVSCLMLMLGGLGGWNALLILRNQTATENYDLDALRRVRRKARHPYDLGTFRNVQSVMGQHPATWLVPLDPQVAPIARPAARARRASLSRGEATVRSNRCGLRCGERTPGGGQWSSSQCSGRSEPRPVREKGDARAGWGWGSCQANDSADNFARIQRTFMLPLFTAGAPAAPPPFPSTRAGRVAAGRCEPPLPTAAGERPSRCRVNRLCP
jgi:ribosomal protein L40E